MLCTAGLVTSDDEALIDDAHTHTVTSIHPPRPNCVNTLRTFESLISPHLEKNTSQESDVGREELELFLSFKAPSFDSS